jgi:RimJ/RimL family protein N-acetyltransferase
MTAARVATLAGVRDVALGEGTDGRCLVVALERAGTAASLGVEIDWSPAESGEVESRETEPLELVVVPRIERRAGVVDPVWLAARRRWGTTLSAAPAREPRLETERLVLRRFARGDLPAMARLHLDPVTMFTLGGPMPDAAASDRAVEWADAGLAEAPLGHLAVTRSTDGAVLGWVGFDRLDVGVALPSDVQIGWRLHREHWGRGYALEAARALIDHARSWWGVQGVVAITAAVNERSRRLMGRLGLEQLAGVEFAHPRVDPASTLSLHVAYVGW